MVIAQGDVLWVEFPDAVGSGPGFRRPAVVVQSLLREGVGKLSKARLNAVLHGIDVVLGR